MPIKYQQKIFSHRANDDWTAIEKARPTSDCCLHILLLLSLPHFRRVFPSFTGWFTCDVSAFRWRNRHMLSAQKLPPTLSCDAWNITKPSFSFPSPLPFLQDYLTARAIFCDLSCPSTVEPKFSVHADVMGSISSS